jgi:acetyltransferase-like isoleucine patch superfamily enzyme
MNISGLVMNSDSQYTLGNHVQLIGKQNIEINEGSCIGDYVWLNVCNRHDSSIRLKIGYCTLVGRGSLLSAGGYLELGDYCLLGPHVLMTEANHRYDDVMQPYMDQGVTEGKLLVEDNCWIGMNAAIVGNVTIGRGSIVAANAVVTKTVPPFAMMAGNPAKIRKLYDFAASAWHSISDQQECERMLSKRESYPPPTREDYHHHLRQNARTKTLNPVLAGRDWL